MGVCAMDSGGWTACLLWVRIRAEDGWTERGNQNDCLHGEDLVSSAIAIGDIDSRVGKATPRVCSNMPTRRHNQRRSQLLRRLARERGVRGTTRLCCGSYIDRPVLRTPTA